jgi:hypothetical protein
MYNDALKLFHIEIRQVQKGHLVFVTDGNGNPIRHPIKMSDFEERPRFYLKIGKIEVLFKNVGESKLNQTNVGKISPLMLVNFLRLLPNYQNRSVLRNRKYNIKRRNGKQRRW